MHVLLASCNELRNSSKTAAARMFESKYLKNQERREKAVKGFGSYLKSSFTLSKGYICCHYPLKKKREILIYNHVCLTLRGPIHCVVSVIYRGQCAHKHTFKN